MTTRIIGIREFRQNMSKLSRDARKNKKPVCFIVMNHSVPVFEVKPIVDEDGLENRLIMEKYCKELEESLAQAERGDVVSLDEVMQEIRSRKKA